MLTTADMIQLAIQNVQVALAWFGYGVDDGIVVKAWTNLDGLRAVKLETRWLLVEFHESFFDISPSSGQDTARFS